MNPKFLQFETERLSLIPTSLEDVDFVLALMNSPNWIKYIGDRNVKTKANAIAYIEEKMLKQLHSKGFSNYTITLKSSGTKIGSCGLYDRPTVDGIDIGFALFSEYEKKGYAFEAAQKLMYAAEHTFKLDKISAITMPENTSSRKLLKRLGLKFSKKINTGNENLMLYELHFHK